MNHSAAKEANDHGDHSKGVVRDWKIGNMLT